MLPWGEKRVTVAKKQGHFVFLEIPNFTLFDILIYLAPGRHKLWKVGQNIRKWAGKVLENRMSGLIVQTN